jgi:hypothetical protein
MRCFIFPKAGSTLPTSLPDVWGTALAWGLLSTRVLSGPPVLRSKNQES